MTISTTLLPGNESRTSTQAIRVPMTRLMAATRIEIRIVSLSAEAASGAVIEFQNEDQPSSRDRQMTAARGMRTMRLR